jgi:uncharacterized protein YqjF (DUF2071 family)
MHPAFAKIDHRPWPLPVGRWTMRQTWRDLLFAHWPVPVAALRRLVPAELTIQEFDNTSWLGVVPFRMTGVTHRWLPSLPWVSAFPELNLRLYVEHERAGQPGVWFLSLDATNPLAVWAARRFFHLPYVRAQIAIEPDQGGFRYRSDRTGPGPRARFTATYRPTSGVYEARPGTLEHFLTERYCLYAQAPGGTLYRADIHHQPWPLQSASAEIETSELLEPHGLHVEGPPALLHFARRLDVVVWPLQRVSAGVS